MPFCCVGIHSQLFNTLTDTKSTPKLLILGATLNGCFSCFQLSVLFGDSFTQDRYLLGFSANGPKGRRSKSGSHPSVAS